MTSVLMTHYTIYDKYLQNAEIPISIRRKMRENWSFVFRQNIKDLQKLFYTFDLKGSIFQILYVTMFHLWRSAAQSRTQDT